MEKLVQCLLGEVKPAKIPHFTTHSVHSEVGLSCRRKVYNGLDFMKSTASPPNYILDDCGGRAIVRNDP